MIIERFDPSADAAKLRACFEMTMAGWSIDHLDAPRWAYGAFAAKWARGFDTDPLQAWLATGESATPVGCYLLRLPTKDNLTTATCIVAVDPARRRSGIGTQLIAHCCEQARRAGRSRLTSHARDDSPGAAFGASLGAQAGIAEVDRVLDIDTALAARLPDLRASARAHAAGYSLVSWTGATPERYVDDVVRLNAAMADAPRNEGMEPHAWDAERLRHVEQTLADYGLKSYFIAARHDATGRLAAVTQIITEAENPDWGFQQITAVLPEHRGHRLGMLVKVGMLDLLAEHVPNVRRIQTGNAGANQHMIAINEQLGFTVLSVYRDWELDLAAPLPAR